MIGIPHDTSHSSFVQRTISCPRIKRAIPLLHSLCKYDFDRLSIRNKPDPLGASRAVSPFSILSSSLNCASSAATTAASGAQPPRARFIMGLRFTTKACPVCAHSRQNITSRELQSVSGFLQTMALLLQAPEVALLNVSFGAFVVSGLLQLQLSPKTGHPLALGGPPQSDSSPRGGHACLGPGGIHAPG